VIRGVVFQKILKNVFAKRAEKNRQAILAVLESVLNV
jgi:hypothetical protein